jgi:hypothetical protein
MLTKSAGQEKGQDANNPHTGTDPIHDEFEGIRRQSYSSVFLSSCAIQQGEV